jgi:hypothetical protein
MLRTATLLTASLALLGGAATPAVAHMHHRGHSAMHSTSTPAERQQTADLNRQQLSQSQSGGSSMATGSSGLATEPTSYQHAPGSTSGTMSGNSTGTMNSGTSSGSDDQSMKTPSNGTMGNPGGAATPPTTTNPGTP